MIITGAATSAYDPNEVHIDIRAEEGDCIKIGDTISIPIREFILSSLTVPNK